MRAPLCRRDFTALLGAAVVAGALPGCSRRYDAVSTPPEAPTSYDEAVRAIRELIARDAADPAILPAALPRLYLHDKPAQHAVVLFHGFTNCPQPVDELADFATSAYGLTRPLGTTVSALGLSLGGTMVQWLAQTQPVDLAVPIAPFLIPYPLPPAIGQPAMRLLATLPSMYFWWDFHIKERCLPHYAYPGYPTHALARLVFFGNVIFAAAAADKPRARRCVLVLSDRDNAIDSGSARHMTEIWNRHGAGYTELMLTGLGPRHDVIDPTTYPHGRTAVYPKLEALVFDERAS